ncbi:MAG: DNA pilot protein [Microviridae sp.]|nr:MAG: DNA pilot protein [Microviridae sp.]
MAFLASMIDAGSAATTTSMQNSAAALEAEKNRDWQETMSNSAHQREVEDLRAAGLNPILSANAGASTPSGAVAPVAKMNLPSALNAQNSAKTREAQDAAIATAKETQTNIKADTAYKKAQSYLTQASARKVERDAGRQEIENSFWGDVNNAYQSGKKSLVESLKTIRDNPYQTADPLNKGGNSAQTAEKYPSWNPAPIKDRGQSTDDERVKGGKDKKNKPLELVIKYRHK